MGEDSVYRVLKKCRDNRKKLLEGGINSIPTPFKRFRQDFTGLQQSRYYIFTAPTKVGKTTCSSFLFLFNTILYAYYNPDKVRLKIFYFNLEEAQEMIIQRFMVYLLFEFSGGNHSLLKKLNPIILTTTNLDSADNVPIDEKYLNMLENEEPYKSILKFFTEHTEFNDSRKTSDAWFACQEYAKEHGKIYKKRYSYKDEFGMEKDGEKFDYYEADDPDEYRILYYDNVNDIEPDTGQTIYQAIHKYSAEYCLKLRDRYGFTIVNVQQQNKDSDGMEAFKLKKLRPSVNELADCKATSNDCDMCLGLFSPFKYEIPEFDGYDITKLGDSFRVLEVLINRRGTSNGRIPLLFIGECNYWCELPKVNKNDPNTLQEINKWYMKVAELRALVAKQQNNI